MDRNVLQQLESLHLSTSEAAVYLALLKIGQTSTGDIIKKTGLHRSVVYESLDKLIDRKLVFKIEKRNIAFFQPTDPRRLLASVKSEYELAKELVPHLQSLIDTKLPEITVHEGIESYRQFWLNSVQQLPIGSIDYIAGSIGSRWQELMGNKLKAYLRIHLERKIKWQMIVFDRDQVEDKLIAQHPELHEYRFIDRPVSKDGNFNIFNDDTLILHSATEPMVIEIQHPSLVKVFRNLFDILWSTGKKI
jgi:sugar-specific transcriptional regulator TrmB